jgi:hypothetical protein
VSQQQLSSLEELRRKNPLELTEAEITTIITALREERLKWNIQQATPKAKPGKTPIVELTMDDLLS